MATSLTYSRSLLHTVASLSYEQDLPQREIAEQLQFSTATVSRLIQRARDEGVVRIEICEFVESGALEKGFEFALTLKRVIVVPNAPEYGAMAALAEPTGQMLRDAKTRPRSVLCPGWGGTIREVVQVGLSIGSVHDSRWGFMLSLFSSAKREGRMKAQEFRDWIRELSRLTARQREQVEEALL